MYRYIFLLCIYILYCVFIYILLCIYILYIVYIYYILSIYIIYCVYILYIVCIYIIYCILCKKYILYHKFLYFVHQQYPNLNVEQAA